MGKQPPLSPLGGTAASVVPPSSTWEWRFGSSKGKWTTAFSMTTCHIRMNVPARCPAWCQFRGPSVGWLALRGGQRGVGGRADTAAAGGHQGDQRAAGTVEQHVPPSLWPRGTGLFALAAVMARRAVAVVCPFFMGQGCPPLLRHLKAGAARSAPSPPVVKEKERARARRSGEESRA